MPDNPTCPLCGSPVTIEGHTTHHYRPAPDPAVKSLRWALSMLEQSAQTIARDYKITCQCDRPGDDACCECRFYRDIEDAQAALDGKAVPLNPRLAALEKAATTELARCRNYLRGQTFGSGMWHMLTAIELGLMEAVEPEAYRAMVAKCNPKSEG